MRKLFYVLLEPYEARYTLQLKEWNEAVFKDRDVDYVLVEGQTLSSDKSIVTGSVLDAHGRSYYSMTQMANLVKMMKQGEITSEDAIFFEDMFTPGIESLPYILDQVPAEYRPKVWVRCLAQSIDPDDFVNREGMLRWMRPFEQMIDNFVTGIIVASEEMVAHLRIAGFKAPIYVSGLPFGKAEVQSRVPNRKPLKERPKRVSFAARWDDEKQPDFYMDLIEEYFKLDPTVEFTVLCGHPELKSNNPAYVERALKLQASDKANFKIYTGLKKTEYYNLLADTRVMFNCALQDWVSNTISEVQALGGVGLYPSYRSFPEVFANNPMFMYTPWSIDDAVDKLQVLMTAIDVGNTKIEDDAEKIVNWQDGTIGRTLDIMQGKGEKWARNTLDYRKYVSKSKF